MENGVELLQSYILYSPPSDLLLSLTIVLKGRVKLYHALTLQMHFRKITYLCGENC